MPENERDAGAEAAASAPAPFPTLPRRVEVRVSGDGSLVVVPDLPAELEDEFERIGTVTTRACEMPARDAEPDSE